MLRKMASSSRFRNSRSTFAKKTVDGALSYMFLIQKKSFNELYHLFCVKSLYLVFAQISFPQAARCDAVNHHLFHVVPLKRYIRETLQNEEKKEIVHKKSIEFDVMTSTCDFLHNYTLTFNDYSLCQQLLRCPPRGRPGRALARTPDSTILFSYQLTVKP